MPAHGLSRLATAEFGHGGIQGKNDDDVLEAKNKTAYTTRALNEAALVCRYEPFRANSGGFVPRIRLVKDEV